MLEVGRLLVQQSLNLSHHLQQLQHPKGCVSLAGMCHHLLDVHAARQAKWAKKA
jgi:hypothetical protein